MGNMSIISSRGTCESVEMKILYIKMGHRYSSPEELGERKKWLVIGLINFLLSEVGKNCTVVSSGCLDSVITTLSENISESAITILYVS